jgi:hypothetical protein
VPVDSRSLYATSALLPKVIREHTMINVPMMRNNLLMYWWCADDRWL